MVHPTKHPPSTNAPNNDFKLSLYVIYPSQIDITLQVKKYKLTQGNSLKDELNYKVSLPC